MPVLGPGRGPAGKPKTKGKPDKRAPKSKSHGDFDDEVQSKHVLLQQLNRQAEINTRILERERALVLAMEMQDVQQQHQGHVSNHAGFPAGQHPGAAAGHHQLHQEQPHQPTSPGRHVGRSHIFLGQPTKVFNPSQVPGLGGNATLNEPVSPFHGHDGPLRSPGPGATFPDSPSFYPGMVFGVPMHHGPGTEQRRPDSPTRHNPPAHQASYQQQPPQRQQDVSNAKADARKTVAPADGPGRDKSPGRNRKGATKAGGAGAAQSDQRAAQEAYRKELAEQIRLRQELKAAEEAAAKQQESKVWAQSQAPPWDPSVPRLGGGGDPVRDVRGAAVTDLRFGRRAGGAGSYTGAPQEQAGPARGGDGSLRKPHHLTVELPGDGGAPPPPWMVDQGAMPHAAPAWAPLPPPPAPSSPGYHHHPPQQHPHQHMHGGWVGDHPAGQHMTQGGWAGGGPAHHPQPLYPPPGAPPHPVQSGSPPGGGPGSPGGHGRVFMAGLAQLKAGPSEEQQRMKELARAQLLHDLDEQVRQKKEREEQRKAEEAAIRAKEEADLAAYHARMQAQREEEKRSAQLAAQQSAAQQEDEHSQGGSYAKGAAKSRRAGKNVIDADWLGPPPQHHHQQHQQQSTVGWAGSGEGSQGGGVMHGPPAGDISGGGAWLRRKSAVLGPPGHPGIGGAERAGGGGGAAGGDFSHVLQQVQQEQAWLREAVSHQAVSLQKLQHNAQAVATDRQQAWQDVARVRSMLGGQEADTTARESDQFVVSTHLLPRDVNSIPSRLGTPIEAEWAAAREPLLVRKDQQAWRAGLLAPVSEHDAQGGDQLYRGWASHSGGGQEDVQVLGLYQPVSHAHGPPSQIPRAPSQMGWHASSKAAAQQPPASRYKSFFNLEGHGGGDGGGPVRVMHDDAGGAGGKQLPQVAFGRRAAAVRAPPSPAILRGPSPDKRSRAAAGAVRGTLSAPRAGRRAPAVNTAAAAAHKPVKSAAPSARARPAAPQLLTADETE